MKLWVLLSTLIVLVVGCGKPSSPRYDRSKKDTPVSDTAAPVPPVAEEAPQATEAEPAMEPNAPTGSIAGATDSDTSEPAETAESAREVVEDPIPRPAITEIISTPLAPVSPLPPSYNQLPIARDLISNPQPTGTARVETPLTPIVIQPASPEWPTLVEPSPAGGKEPVWKNLRKWTRAEEVRFSRWVELNWHDNLFISPTWRGKENPFYGLPTDCADAAYFMRIIYSWERNLPFKMVNQANHSAKFGRFITNDMTRWSGKTDAIKIRGFLEFVSRIGSTKSLPQDTYPVAIKPETLRPGAVALKFSDTNHARQLINIDKYGIPHFLNSTTPQAVRPLSRTFGWHNVEVTKKPMDGIRAWRQPSQIQKRSTSIPGYSLEQWSMTQEELQDRFKKEEARPETLLRLYGEQICSKLNVRVYSVQAAEVLKVKTADQCLNRDQFSEYSTEFLDYSVRMSFFEAQSLYKALDDKSVLSAEERVTWAQIMEPKKEDKTSLLDGSNLCVIQVSPGYRLGLTEIQRRILRKGLISNPNAPLLARWGETSWEESCEDYSELKN